MSQQTHLQNLDDQTKYNKLLTYLQTKALQVTKAISSAGPHLGSPGYQDNKDYHQPRLALITEILEEVERIETGAEDLNRKADFLGADGPPSESRFR